MASHLLRGGSGSAKLLLDNQQQQRQLQVVELGKLKFCGQCIHQKKQVCEARAQHLLRMGVFSELTNTQQQKITTIEQARASITDSQCYTVTGEPPPDPNDEYNAAQKDILMQSYCGTCPWQEGMGFDCNSRIAYLMNTYYLSEYNARESVLEDGLCIDPNFDFNAAAQAKLINFCSGCYWKGTDLTCEERAKEMEIVNKDMSLQDARISLLDDCNIHASEESSSKQSSLSGGAIAGIVLTMIMLLIFLIVLGVRWKKKRENVMESKKSSKLSEEESKHDLENQAIPKVDQHSASGSDTRSGSQSRSPSPPEDKEKEEEESIQSAREEPPEDLPALTNPAMRSRTPTPEPEVEVWIHCFNNDDNTVAESAITFDEDWSKAGVPADPDGDVKNLMNPSEVKRGNNGKARTTFSNSLQGVTEGDEKSPLREPRGTRIDEEKEESVKGDDTLGDSDTVREMAMQMMMDIDESDNEDNKKKVDAPASFEVSAATLMLSVGEDDMYGDCYVDDTNANETVDGSELGG